MLIESLALALLVNAPQSVDFEREVLPILRESCFECHSASRAKPKGGLRLDGIDWIREGGVSGSALTPGDAAKSELFTRVALSHDDLDIMPPNSEPLSAEKIAKLRSWIDEGASFGTWTGVKRDAAEIESRPQRREPERIRVWRELGAGVSIFDAKSLPSSVRKLASIEDVFPGSPLVRVGFMSYESDVNDALIKRLASACSNLAVLNLSRTSITNRSLENLKGAKVLTHLNLTLTKIGDAGLKSLASLPELRSLNLYGTQVSDASLELIGKLPKLTDLYLGGSHCTATGLAALRKARPGMRIRD